MKPFKTYKVVTLKDGIRQEFEYPSRRVALNAARFWIEDGHKLVALKF